MGFKSAYMGPGLYWLGPQGCVVRAIWLYDNRLYGLGLRAITYSVIGL
jgi:hypothetical protein